MGLAEYQRKRHFDKTAEPGPKQPGKQGWSYVIQKHDASRLHYDFRLELDGVLKSWAVPKRVPASTRPSNGWPCRLRITRLPMDRSRERFHRVNTAGEPSCCGMPEHGNLVGDPAAGYRDGKLKFILHGQKLQGGWSLVRTHRAGEVEKSPQWLLFKERDDEAQSTKKGDILEQKPLSVASSRDLDEIATASDRVWSSKKSFAVKKSAAAKKSPLKAF